MARSNATDVLQTFPFWLMDLGPIDTFAFPLLTPLFGFASISSPELTIETQEIPEGNWLYTRKVLKRGSVGNLTLTRGATFYDADFWRWVTMGLTGDTSGASVLPGVGPAVIPPGIMDIGGPTYRRSMLLIQYFPKVLFPGGTIGGAITGALATTGLAMAAGAVAGVDVSMGSVLTLGGALTLGLGGIGPFEFAARVPAKGWLLKDVIPVRYKPSADFDAMNNAISMMELEVAYERFEEISLAG